MITRKNLHDLIDFQKNGCRELEAVDDISEDNPQILTVACNDELEYGFQIGDNSYSGPVYHFPHWSVVYLTSDSSTSSLVEEIVNQLEELLPESASIPN